jgi:hypothetical protein
MLKTSSNMWFASSWLFFQQYVIRDSVAKNTLKTIELTMSRSWDLATVDTLCFLSGVPRENHFASLHLRVGSWVLVEATSKTCFEKHECLSAISQPWGRNLLGAACLLWTCCWKLSPEPWILLQVCLLILLWVRNWYALVWGHGPFDKHKQHIIYQCTNLETGSGSPLAQSSLTGRNTCVQNIPLHVNWTDNFNWSAPPLASCCLEIKYCSCVKESG